MKRISIWLLWAATAGCSAILLAGCGTQTRQRWLHVFFTGVEVPKSEKLRQSVPASGTNAAALQASVGFQPPASVHKPYAERECAACHLAGQAQELKPGGGKVCLECHTKLIGTAKYVHAPVENKDCIACHAPHDSAERFLLTRKAKELCLDCHDAAELGKVQQHALAGARGCVDCHDPHRSDLPKLAKASR